MHLGQIQHSGCLGAYFVQSKKASAFDECAQIFGNKTPRNTKVVAQSYIFLTAKSETVLCKVLLVICHFRASMTHVMLYILPCSKPYVMLKRVTVDG